MLSLQIEKSSNDNKILPNRNLEILLSYQKFPVFELHIQKTFFASTSRVSLFWAKYIQKYVYPKSEEYIQYLGKLATDAIKLFLYSCGDHSVFI